MHTLSFQAPEAMAKQLAEYAELLERSKGHLMRQALTEFLADMEDYLEAREYKENYDPAENVPLSAIKKKYKLD